MEEFVGINFGLPNGNELYVGKLPKYKKVVIYHVVNGKKEILATCRNELMAVYLMEWLKLLWEGTPVVPEEENK